MASRLCRQRAFFSHALFRAVEPGPEGLSPDFSRVALARRWRAVQMQGVRGFGPGGLLDSPLRSQTRGNAADVRLSAAAVGTREKSGLGKASESIPSSRVRRWSLARVSRSFCSLSGPFFRAWADLSQADSPSLSRPLGFKDSSRLSQVWALTLRDEQVVSWQLSVQKEAGSRRQEAGRGKRRSVRSKRVSRFQGQRPLVLSLKPEA